MTHPVGMMMAWILAVCLAGSTQAAELRVGSVDTPVGGAELAVPLTMDCGGGEAVCAVQVDLSYNPAVLAVKGVEAGAVAVDAAKNVVYSDLASGKIRIIAAGFNQNVLASGVVANIQLTVANSATDGTYPLDLSGALLSDAVGTSISCSAVDGSVVVGTGASPLPDNVGCGAGILGGGASSLSLGDGLVVLALVAVLVLLFAIRKRFHQFHCLA